MKRFFPIVLALLFTLLLLSSCQNNTGTTTPTTTPEGSDTVTGTPTQTMESVDIALDNKSISITQGQSAVLGATILKEEDKSQRLIYVSSDSSIAYVDQKGNIIGISEGNAEITVKTPTGLSAKCSVSVGAKNDEFDSFDLTNAEEIYWSSYINDGLYMDDKGNLTFSPSIWEFQQCLKFGASSYRVYLRFTHNSSNNVPQKYTFPSIVVEPKKSSYSDYTMNLFLLAKNNQGTFCPIAGENYDIEYIIIKKSTKEALFYGVFEDVKAVEDIKTSEFYSPTAMPGYLPKNDNEQYLSYTAGDGGQIDGGDLQAHEVGTKGYEVTATPKAGYKFYGWNDGVKTPTRTDVVKDGKNQYKAYFIRESREDMPIANMYIFTSTGKPVNTKFYINAEMLIVGASKEKYDISATLQIKGRGNSSWDASAPQTSYDSKNSYRLKFDEETKLLGIGDSKNRDWVLNANKFDLSGLRNYLIWDFADRMGTLPYVTDCQWVQLYVNCEYRGMYMVTEHVEVANDRVNVDDTIESTDKGYLIEIDFRGTDEGQPYFYVEGYGAASNDNPREFVVKSQCNDEDLEYIASYIRKCHNALVSGNKALIEQLVDIPSLIDMYIIEELTKDVDVGAASFYMQKSPGGKIYFTAPWDFDFGFGTYGKAVSYEEMVSVGEEGCTWFAALVEHEWFRKAVLDRMNELDGDFKATLDAVKAKADELESSADKNAIFWDMYGNNYHRYVSSSVSSDLKTYDEHIDYLINWSEARWKVMKDFLSTYGK